MREMAFYKSLALGLPTGLAAHLWADCSLLCRVLQPTAAAVRDAWGPDSPGSGEWAIKTSFVWEQKASIKALSSAFDLVEKGGGGENPAPFWASLFAGQSTGGGLTVRRSSSGLSLMKSLVSVSEAALWTHCRSQLFCRSESP